MVENGSQLTRPCVCLPYKKSIWITTFSSQECEEAAEVKHGDSLTPPARNLLLFQRNYVRIRRGWTSISPLWENEALYSFTALWVRPGITHQYMKPPILQDVGNLEQEMTVTQTLTSLSLTPCSLGWRWKGSEYWRRSFRSGLHQVHTPDDHRSGGRKLWYILISLQDILFLLKLSVMYKQHPHLNK